MKSLWLHKDLGVLLHFYSSCSLGTFFYQPQIANAKMVNQSEASQKIDLKTFNPSQQEAQQLEELKASGDALGPLSTEVTIVLGVVVAIFLAVVIYHEHYN